MEREQGTSPCYKNCTYKWVLVSKSVNDTKLPLEKDSGSLKNKQNNSLGLA